MRRMFGLSLIVMGAIALLGATLLLGACSNPSDSVANSGRRPIYGEGLADASRVVATVNGEDITEHMLDLRIEELTGPEKMSYLGPEGRRLYVRRMVEELLRVRDAEDRQLALDPVVARVLTIQYRAAMDLAQQAELAKRVEPSVDDIRGYFEEHRDRYVNQGMMNASHIECSSMQEAQEAYRELTEDKRSFPYVVGDYSKNAESRRLHGELGWFNQGGFVPHIKDGSGFTELIWDFENGVNPPFEFKGAWHVVQVNDRRYGRQQTLDEAYQRVVADVLPELQNSVHDEWLREAKKQAEIEYFGEFRPGHGKTAKELFERAYYLKDPEQKIETLTMLVEDYPDDEYAADALFTAANVTLDTWGDLRKASYLLETLVRGYPESEYVPDAQYMLDNMFKANFTKPESIEDLRNND